MSGFIGRGPRGPAGPRGAPGADGKDGKDGKDGLDGKDGKDGLDGRDGLDGKDGKDGKPGEAGPAGPAGPIGPRGPAGYTPAGLYEVSEGGEDVTHGPLYVFGNMLENSLGFNFTGAACGVQDGATLPGTPAWYVGIGTPIGCATSFSRLIAKCLGQLTWKPSTRSQGWVKAPEKRLLCKWEAYGLAVSGCTQVASGRGQRTLYFYDQIVAVSGSNDDVTQVLERSAISRLRQEKEVDMAAIRKANFTVRIAPEQIALNLDFAGVGFPECDLDLQGTVPFLIPKVVIFYHDNAFYISDGGLISAEGAARVDVPITDFKLKNVTNANKPEYKYLLLQNTKDRPLHGEWPAQWITIDIPVEVYTDHPEGYVFPDRVDSLIPIPIGCGAFEEGEQWPIIQSS